MTRMLKYNVRWLKDSVILMVAMSSVCPESSLGLVSLSVIIQFVFVGVYGTFVTYVTVYTFII